MESQDLKRLVHFSNDALQREPVHESLRIWSELLCLSSNQSFGPVRDPDSDAVFLVVAGEAAFQVDGRRRRLQQWSTVLVPADAEVVVNNASVDPLVVLVTAAPPPVVREVTG